MLYTAVRVPYAIAFDVDEFAQLDVWFWFNRVVDAVFIGDMAIICMTAQIKGKRIVTSVRRIIANYMKSWFALDLSM